MSNEIPSDAGNWKGRLDQLDALPGETWTSKEASWETLYDRIKDKPRRRKPFYRMAAAAVLVGLCISLAIDHEKRERFTKTDPIPASGVALATPSVGSAVHAGSIRPLSFTGRSALKAVPSHPTGAPSHPVESQWSGKTAAITPKAINHSARILEATPSLVTAPLSGPPLSGSPNVQSNQSMATAAVTNPALGKKMRVVHINELGDPPEGENGNPLPRGLVPPGKHPIQLLFGSADSYSNVSIEKQQTEKGLLEIKIHQ